MKLDAWQVRVAIQGLKTVAYARRRYLMCTLRGDDAERDPELRALEAMAAALESGESLEVGP